MIVDFKTVKLAEIIGRLKTYEERIKVKKGSQEESSEKLLFTRQENDRSYERSYGNGRRGGGNQTQGRGRGRFTRDSKNEDSYDRRRRNLGDQNYHRRDLRDIECYNCHEFGHYAANCPKPDRRKQVSNLVVEDDEPALLMVTSKDEDEMAYLEEEPRRNEIFIEKDEISKEKLEDMRSKIETDLRSKLELWKLEILQDIEMEKQEFEEKMRNREMAFEKQMQRRLENLKNLRDCTSKEMRELKSKEEQFEKENYEVGLDEKHLKGGESIDEGKCKKHGETPSRFPKESKIEKDIKSSNKRVGPEDRDTSTTRNKLLESQDYDMIRIAEDTDKTVKDERDEIEDKKIGNQVKKKAQDTVRVKDKDKGSGNKPKFRK